MPKQHTKGTQPLRAKQTASGATSPGTHLYPVQETPELKIFGGWKYPQTSITSVHPGPALPHTGFWLLVFPWERGTAQPTQAKSTLEEPEATEASGNSRRQSVEGQRQKGGGRAEKRHPDHSQQSSKEGLESSWMLPEMVEQSPADAPSSSGTRIRSPWSWGQQHDHGRESKAVLYQLGRVSKPLWREGDNATCEEQGAPLSLVPHAWAAIPPTLAPAAGCQALVTSSSTGTLPTAARAGGCTLTSLMVSRNHLLSVFVTTMASTSHPKELCSHRCQHRHPLRDPLVLCRNSSDELQSLCQD